MSFSITIDQELSSLQDDADQLDVCRFLACDFSTLSPPYFNWQPLQKFFQCDHPKDPERQRLTPDKSSQCLFDYIQISTKDNDYSEDGADADRRSSASSETTCCAINSNSSPHVVERNIMSDHQLRQRLGQSLSDDADIQKPDRQRTVLFLTNMRQSTATVLAVKGEGAYQTSLRRFLQGYVSGEIEFLKVKMMHPGGHDIHRPRHLNFSDKFDFEFHLSYVALRKIGAGDDVRGIRASTQMIEPLDGCDPAENLVCYDAQISLLVVGKDDTDWKAYCCVDTWFDSEQDARRYLDEEQDGPSGGARHTDDPCWNPREYFLMVLAQRFRQTGMEWGNLFIVLMERLDAYESYYLRTIDTTDLNDNQSMFRNRSYSRAASMLRQYHDTLSTNLDRLKNFLGANKHFFEDQKDFQDQCGCYFNIIDNEITHLERWRCRLYQRMLRFDSMRDGLFNASALRESRRSTKQANDIGVLTYVTVAFLPMTLAASILSMSTITPAAFTWIVWAGVSAVVGLATIYFAFGRKIIAYLRREKFRNLILFND